MTEQLSHHRREGVIEMNFSRLILDLYKSGDIWFDDDATLNLSAKATVEIQEHIKPKSIFTLDLDDTVAGLSIRKDWESKRYQENNCERIKNQILSDTKILYGVA